MLKSITLTNFRSYGFGTVEFQPGINILVGPSGAGKSSLIQAIGAALFGDNFGRWTQLVRRGQGSGQVEVDLGDLLVRQSFGNGATAQLFRSEAILAEGKTETASYLAEVLQTFDLRELWRNVIYVPQFGVLNGLTEPPSKRKAHFDAILGVDQYEQAWAALREPASLMKNRLELATQKRNMLAAQASGKDDIESELHLLRDSMLDTAGRTASLVGEKVLLQDELNAISDQANELRDKIKQARLNQSAAQRLQREIAACEAAVAADQEHLDRISRDIDGLKQLEDWMQANAAIPVDYQNALYERSQVMQSISDSITRFLEQAKTLRQAVEVLQTGTCPVCLRPVEDGSILDGYLADMRSLDGRLRALEQEQEETEDKWKLEIEPLMTKANDYSRKTDALTRLPYLEKDRDNLAAKIAAKQAKNKALAAQLAEIGSIDPEPHENALNALKEADKREKFHRLNTDIRLLEEKLRNLKERKVGLDERLEAMARIETEIAVLETEIAVLETGVVKLAHVRDAYRKVAPALASRVVALVGHEANKIFSEVWAHRSGKIEWHTDYGVSVWFDGVDHGFDVSGGQQVSAALALRLGLLSVLSPVKLLVLDEATMGSLDRETAVIVPELVNRIVERGFQVIAVDHSGLFDNVAVNRIEIQNIDGESRIV